MALRRHWPPWAPVAPGNPRPIPLPTQGDDPIVPWQQYIAWVLASYPSGADRAALPVLEWCTRELASHPRYARDVRYLRVWVQYANFLRDPLDGEAGTRWAAVGPGSPSPGTGLS